MNAKRVVELVSNKRIGVLMGGISAERDVSLKTGAAVLASLKRMGIDAVGIDAGRDLCERVKEERIDIAFIALHGRYGEDGCVQGALELMGVPYTGSGVEASAVAMDKAMTKTIMNAIGVTTPPWRMFSKKTFKGAPSLTDIKAPVVVKPSASGSSIGVAICSSDEEILPALEKAFEEDTSVMVEEFVEGTLVTLGILGDRVLPPIEIETVSGFYDYEHKYTPGRTNYHLPARLDSQVLDRASEITMRAHNALGCEGVSRSELIVDDEGELWFLELNTLPGMTETSLLPKAAQAVGLSFDDLTLAILEAALDG